jgi:predicted dehydrogenase
MNNGPLLDLDYKVKLPEKADYGIGIIGAGQIVNQAHLPAYRKAGFRVLAIADKNEEAAKATAARFEIPRVCSSVDQLLAMPDVDIVDIAVPAASNPALSKQAFVAGKHALVQKPMAETSAEAAEMVAAAPAHKRKLAVNQQMRWSPSVRAASDLLRRQLLGELIEARIEIQIRTGWDAWPWLAEHPYPEIYYHTIHHIDTMRAWLRDPIRVYASLAHYPEATYKGPTRGYMIFEYPGNLRTMILVNHHSTAPNDRLRAEFFIEGTNGRCEGLIGLLLNYPTGRSDLFRLSHRELVPQGMLELELEGRWFPDAFIGPMASLMDAITWNGEAETSGAEVQKTIRLVEAIRESHERKQAITLST